MTEDVGVGVARADSKNARAIAKADKEEYILVVILPERQSTVQRWDSECCSPIWTRHLGYLYRAPQISVELESSPQALEQLLQSNSVPTWSFNSA